MNNRLGICFSTAGTNRIPQSHLDDAVIRGKSSQPIRLRLERDVWPDNVEEIRFHTLHLRDELRVEA